MWKFLLKCENLKNVILYEKCDFSLKCEILLKVLLKRVKKYDFLIKYKYVKIVI